MKAIREVSVMVLVMAVVLLTGRCAAGPDDEDPHAPDTVVVMVTDTVRVFEPDSMAVLSFEMQDSTTLTVLMPNVRSGTYWVFVNDDSMPTLWGESHLGYRYYMRLVPGERRKRLTREGYPTVLFMRMMTGAVKVARGDTLTIRRMW